MQTACISLTPQLQLVVIWLQALGTLNISSADFIVGTANSSSSDPDNVYLYANDLIQVNGLGFSGRSVWTMCTWKQ